MAIQELDASEYSQIAGAGVVSTIGRWLGGSLGWEGMMALLGRAGQAGSNASEIDNGGTSYGIGVCNTFGC